MRVRYSLALTALALLSALSTPAGAQVFENRPDAVVCPLAAIADRPGGFVVFHVVWQEDTGITHYATMGMQPFRLKIDANGMTQAPNLEGCDGKTVEELREAKRAFYYR